MGNAVMLTQEWWVVKCCSLLWDKERKSGIERQKEGEAESLCVK